MRTIDEIRADTQVQRIEILGDGLYGGIFLPRGAKRALQFVYSVDDSAWEHVSISIPGRPNQTPSWAEMCAAKGLFWRPDEEVHQIHAKEKDYFHGFHEMTGVLHLWRPVGGWKEEEPDGGQEKTDIRAD